MYKMPTSELPVRIFIPICYIFAALLIMALIPVHFLSNIPFSMFTEDPAASMNYNPMFGYISNVGIIFWCAAATVCFLSAGILNIRKDQSEAIRFLICFGALTTVLMFDDLFMFHEFIGPDGLYIPEKVNLLMFGAFALFCFIRFYKVILSNDFRYLVIATAAFGFSVLVDQIYEKNCFPGKFFLEDGAKFIGIVSWLIYFVDFSFNKIMSVLAVSQIEVLHPRRSPKVRKRERTDQDN